MMPTTPTRNHTKPKPVPTVCQAVYHAESCRIQSFTIENGRLQSPDHGQPSPYNPQADETNWLHFVGITDAGLLQELLAPFHIHNLVIEDILNHKQRPKIEDYQDYLFIAARVFQYTNNKLISDPVYLIVGRNFILTFQRRSLGLFDEIRESFTQKQHLHSKPADYLAYLLIDRLIDDYFITIEQYNNRVEAIDHTLFKAADNTSALLERIHKLKRDAIRLRRSLLPMRDVISTLLRGDFATFSSDLHIYLRDTYDHTLQLLESLDSARDMVISMMDIHLSFQSNRLNQQMRVLTVITILFMPLTVITGIYGMNFDYMPELHWHYGYFIVLGLMLLIVVSLLIFFSRRKWL